MSRGHLDVRVEDPASDELGILIESFNQMIADIQTGQERLAQKTAEQEARKQYIETLLNTVYDRGHRPRRRGPHHHHQPFGPGHAGLARPR